MEQTLLIDSDNSAGDKPFELYEFLEALGLLDNEDVAKATASSTCIYARDNADMSDSEEDSDDDSDGDSLTELRDNYWDPRKPYIG